MGLHKDVYVWLQPLHSKMINWSYEARMSFLKKKTQFNYDLISLILDVIWSYHYEIWQA